MLRIVFFAFLGMVISSQYLKAESLDLVKQKERNALELQRVLMGVAAYHYWQGGIFKSLITIAEARKYTDKENFIPRYRFFEAKVEESFGLSRRASTSYLEIIKQLPDSHLLNESVLHGASAVGQSKGYDASIELLSTVNGEATQRQLADKQGKQAQYYLNLKRVEDAERILTTPEGQSIWLAYSYYNLAMSIQSENPEKAIALLDKALQATSEDSEGVLVKGQTKLAMGYLLLRLGKTEQALNVFSGIGIDSPFLQKALLGYGWVAIKSNRFDEAIRAFSSIDNGSMDSVAILESLLALAYAKEKSGVQSEKLLAYYEFAGNRYEKELYRLDSAELSVKEGVLSDITKLTLVLRSENPYATLDEIVPPGVSDTLPIIFKDEQLQLMFEEFVTLSKLTENLEYWQVRIGALSERESVFWQSFLSKMPHIRYRKLEQAKLLEYEKKSSEFSKSSQWLDLTNVQSDRFLQFQARLQEAEIDYASLKKMAVLIQDQLAMQPVNDEIYAVSRKIRMLEGVIRWNGYEYLPQQKWTKEKELIRLRKEISLMDEKSRQMEVTFKGQFIRAEKAHLRRLDSLKTAEHDIRRLLSIIKNYQLTRLETFNNRMLSVFSKHRAMAEKYLLQARLASTRLFQYSDVSTQ